ncbi:MAG: hypothetical protein MR384_11810 [Lachnospiraceae bacterium]|nr:hypothetical protein [Lachnospiraceae bacterium]
MIKDNMRIKESITLQDRINAIETIVSFYFMDGDYTPYYKDEGEISAVIRNFIDGIEFEKGESVFSAYYNDENLRKLVNMFILKPVDKEPESEEDERIQNSIRELYDMMETIREYVADKVEFEKQKYLHANPDLDKIVMAADTIIDSFENFSQMNFEIFTPENLEKAQKIFNKISESGFELTAENIINVIKDASSFNMDEATKEIVDAKNSEIRELKEKIKKLENGKEGNLQRVK